MIQRGSRVRYSYIVKEKVLIGVIIFLVLVTGVVWKAKMMDRSFAVDRVIAGDEIVLEGGVSEKLLGVDTTVMGEENDELSRQFLVALSREKNVWIEKENGGVWLWVGCESSPKFFVSSIFQEKGNPKGCKEGVLVNEQLVKLGFSEPSFSDNGSGTKYRSRLVQ